MTSSGVAETLLGVIGTWWCEGQTVLGEWMLSFVHVDTAPIGVTRLSQGVLLDKADQDTCL